MASSGTAYPGALDPALDATLDDDVDPEHANTADARARAVQVKVGADGSTDATSLDYRLRHLAVQGTGMSVDAEYFVLASVPMVDKSAVTVHVDVVGFLEDGTAAVGIGLTATYRCTGGAASVVGTPLRTHDQRTGLADADVLITDDGATTLRVFVTSGAASRVHWTARGTAVVARPGGM